MDKINDGGPAFPLQSIGPDFAPGYAGMALRDYFAAKAMEAIINKAPLISIDSREGTLPEDYAEFERAMIRERTKKGLAVARQEGRVGGRRPKLKDQQSKELAKLVLSGQLTQAEAARLFCVHRSTVSRLLHRTRSEIANP